MDKKVLKNFIISVAVLVILIVILTLSALYDVNLGPLKILSVKTLMSQYSQITTANTNLEQQKSKYQSTMTSLETAKCDFKTQKSKYDSISDDTINIIKEATTNEKYDIEYIWVKLGNYAKENNLSIVLIEPGGSSASATAQSSNTSGTSTTTSTTSNPNGSNTSSQTTTTNGNTNNTNNNGTTTQSGSVPTKQADASASENTVKSSDNKSTPSNATAEVNKLQNVTGGTTATGTTGTSSTTGGTTATNPGILSNPSSSSSSNTLKIQVTGNYLNISDFIFDLENDSELKFKLDDISMEYVGSNNIKASFSVKNMTVIK